MKNNVIIFRLKPKRILLSDIDSIGILFKNGEGVLLPSKFKMRILQILKDNNSYFYIDGNKD